MYVTKGLAEEEETHEGQSQKGYRGQDWRQLFLSVTLGSDLLVPGIGIPFPSPPASLVPPHLTSHPFRLTQMSPPSSGTSSPCSTEANISICVSMALHAFFT